VHEGHAVGVILLDMSLCLCPNRSRARYGDSLVPLSNKRRELRA
jgi:hypothetical protein